MRWLGHRLGERGGVAGTFCKNQWVLMNQNTVVIPSPPNFLMRSFLAILIKRNSTWSSFTNSVVDKKVCQLSFILPWFMIKQSLSCLTALKSLITNASRHGYSNDTVLPSLSAILPLFNQSWSVISLFTSSMYGKHSRFCALVHKVMNI